MADDVLCMCIPSVLGSQICKRRTKFGQGLLRIVRLCVSLGILVAVFAFRYVMFDGKTRPFLDTEACPDWLRSHPQVEAALRHRLGRRCQKQAQIRSDPVSMMVVNLACERCVDVDDEGVIRSDSAGNIGTPAPNPPSGAVPSDSDSHAPDPSHHYSI